MALRYKIDVLSILKDAGYSAYRIRKEQIFSESTLQKIRKKEVVSPASMNEICKLLRLQPGDILEYIEE